MRSTAGRLSCSWCWPPWFSTCCCNWASYGCGKLVERTGPVGRHAFQRSGSPAHVSYFERHSAGRRAPGGLRGETTGARRSSWFTWRTYIVFSVFRFVNALLYAAFCIAKRVRWRINHQEPAADGAGHCAADLHDSDCFDPARQVARHPADGTGRLGGRADADFP